MALLAPLAVLAVALMAMAVVADPAEATPPAGASWGQHPVSLGSAASWTEVPQVEMDGFVVEEAAWRPWVRAPGVPGWALLLLLPTLIALRRPLRSGGNRRVAALLSLALMGLAGALGGVLVQRLVPPPPMLRGLVQRRPVAPPPGTRVVYAWGESTMHGDVWWPHLSIPKVVDWSLGGRLGGQPLQVQNLAEPGTSLTAGFPERLVPVFTEPERYGTAAVIIYVGHNAYYNLRPDPTVLPADLDEERASVERIITRRLRRIATLAEQAKVPVFVALPVANRDGHPPMAPTHADGVSEADQRAYERAIDEAERALTTGDAERALQATQRASRLSPKHAWAIHLRGRALRALGRDEAAKEAFAQAVTLDHNRQRVTERHRALIAGLCRDTTLRCVDAEAALGVPWLDDSWFIDMHHPIAAGHARLGEAFARALAKTAGDPPPKAVPADPFPPELDPRAAVFDRLVQTGSWYLILSEELRSGYARARREALARAEAQSRAIEAALPALGNDRDKRQTWLTLAILIACAKEQPERARRLLSELEELREGSESPAPFQEPWMQRLVTKTLGAGALAGLAPSGGG